MKKYLIASMICSMLLFISVIVNVLLVLIHTNGVVNNYYLMTFIIVEAISVSIVMTTIILLQPYSNVINDLEKAKYEAYEKNRQLNILIAKYNENLVANNNG